MKKFQHIEEEKNRLELNTFESTSREEREIFLCPFVQFCFTIPHVVFRYPSPETVLLAHEFLQRGESRMPVAICSERRTFFIFDFVLHVNGVRFGLSWIFWIRFIQQFLNAEQKLFDGDGRTPIFLFVE